MPLSARAKEIGDRPASSLTFKDLIYLAVLSNLPQSYLSCVLDTETESRTREILESKARAQADATLEALAAEEPPDA